MRRVADAPLVSSACSAYRGVPLYTPQAVEWKGVELNH